MRIIELSLGQIRKVESLPKWLVYTQLGGLGAVDFFNEFDAPNSTRWIYEGS